MSTRIHVSLAVALCLTTPLFAADCFVSPTGSDDHPGTRDEPFRTVQKAADVMRAGDICVIEAGRYRETVTLRHSGAAGKPIRFVAARGLEVVIDGTDPVKTKWTRHEGGIWKTALNRPQIEQLFVDDAMQHEARWPDMPFEKRWDRKHWARTGKGSEYGRIEAKGLAATGVDWTGAIAMMNIGHQFFTWTRNVASRKAGTDFITYDRDLPGLAFLDPKKGLKAQGKEPPWLAKQWHDDYFYLFGKLEALTAPTEWFHDPEAKLLYYMPEGKQAPRNVAVKARDYGIQAEGVEHVVLRGIRFMGCAFGFKKCSHVSLMDCHVLYPNHKRRIVATEQKRHKAPYPAAMVSGSNNRIERCSVQFAGGKALVVSGEDNVVENCIIRDACWSGTLHYSLMGVYGKGNLIRRNTISQSGSPLLHHKGPNIIEYNHIYNGGILSEDVSGVYTQGAPDGEGARGAIIRYNWVHGVRTGHDLGQGIRGDDMTRGLIVHHNVVWDCGMTGIIVKGGQNQIFNNTIFNVTNGNTKKLWRSGGLIIPTQPEPRKPWKPYHKLNIYLDVQNADSHIANNLVDDIYWRKKKIKAPGIRANFEAQAKTSSYLVDVDKCDFRLRPSAVGRLPKAVRVTTEEGAKSSGSYIGAYAPGEPAWVPGADWSL
jgi:hypothetical protein